LGRGLVGHQLQAPGPDFAARGARERPRGAVDEQTIKAYIESQKWGEDEQKFKITAPTEP
jgi:hypothetical protein